MKTLSVSEAKMKLSQLVDQVHRRDEEVVITKNGRPVAVMISPDERESYRETLIVQSDPELLTELRRGLDALKKKRAKLYTLEELFED
jgi:prevent-host-death family protein